MYTMLDSIVKREDLGVVIKKQCGDCAYKCSNNLHYFANSKLLTLYSQVCTFFIGGEVICWFSAWLYMHVSSYHECMCDLLVLNVQIACKLWSPTSPVPGFNKS